VARLQQRALADGASRRGGFRTTARRAGAVEITERQRRGPWCRSHDPSNGAVLPETRAPWQGLALPYRGDQPGLLVSCQRQGRKLWALPPGARASCRPLRRCLARQAAVAFAPQAHFSLGCRPYVQATSPIRRYGDWWVQRQLAGPCFREEPLARRPGEGAQRA